MKKREPVSHIMTKDLYTVNVQNSLHEANALFSNHNVRHIPVVSGESLIGILSLTDMMRISFGSNFGDEQANMDEAIFEMLTIEQVMKAKPKTVSPEDSIKEVAEILTKEEFHALPVTDGDKLVGIVTTTDVIKYLLEQY